MTLRVVLPAGRTVVAFQPACLVVNVRSVMVFGSPWPAAQGRYDLLCSSVLLPGLPQSGKAWGKGTGYLLTERHHQCPILVLSMGVVVVFSPRDFMPLDRFKLGVPVCGQVQEDRNIPRCARTT